MFYFSNVFVAVLWQSHILNSVLDATAYINRRMGMRSQIKRIRRPLTDEELDAESVERRDVEGRDLNGIIEKISLEKISHEERRREAKKPLYLVRYE